jgi:Arc/MetJ-type ribon-helix-helix transcriptional regulator
LKGEPTYKVGVSKITFRADDELVEQLEAHDASKSEVMRAALRAYLDESERDRDTEPQDTTEAELATLLDRVLERRLRTLLASGLERTTAERGVRHGPPRDTTSVSDTGSEDLSDASAESLSDASVGRLSDTGDSRSCEQCGAALSDDHVYCPNCGEKAARRLFCDCGDEVRSDWSFCPSCGRRTPAADVLAERPDDAGGH